MKELLEFLSSPEFITLACIIFGIAVVGGIIGGLFSTWIADRERRRAMRSRSTRFLERL